MELPPPTGGAGWPWTEEAPQLQLPFPTVPGLRSLWSSPIGLVDRQLASGYSASSQPIRHDWCKLIDSR